MDVRYHGLDSPPVDAKARLKDISREGLRLYGGDISQKGIFVEMEIKIPGKATPVPAFGEIMWCRKSDESSYNTGVRFTKIKPEDRAKLLDYVYQELIKTKESL